MAADYQLTLRDYLAIARRWWLAMGLTFCAVLAASVVIALLMPRIYESTGTLLAEAPQVPGDVVRSASVGNAEQRLQALRQRVLTRETLLRIADEHRLFDQQDGGGMKESNIVEAMRHSINVRVQIGNMPAWERPTNNFAFDVSFQHGDPEKALAVTKALIDLFLKSSAQERVDQASRTNEFLTREADRVKQQLEELEKRIATFKRSQGSPSGEGQAVALSSIQTMEADLRAAEREHRLALDEVQTLQVELNGARASLTAPGSGVVNTPSQSEQELDRARSELARIKGIYTEDHPDVRAQQRRIAMLEQAVRAEGSTPSPTRDNAAAQARLAVSRLEARIETARARANLLADQQRNLRNSIGEQRAQILRAPQVERELATLQRDYEAARTQYADLRAKQLSAQLVENLEGEQKGERFTLLEPPLMPEYAVKPERRKLVALGFFVAIAVAVGMVLVLEKLFGRVQGMTAVTALTGQRPMVVVPYITTAEETRSLELLRKRIYWAGVCFGVVALVIVHTAIVPLHSLFISLFSHLG